MNQSELYFSYPTPEELSLKPGTQCRILYERLLVGPVDNGEILFKLRIGNHTGRLSDLRAKLRPYLYDIKATPDQMDRSKVMYRVVG